MVGLSLSGSVVMRHLISFVLVTGGLVLAPPIRPAQGQQESPPAPAVRDHYPFTPSHDWLPQVKSLRLTAETRWKNTPEEIERRRRSLRRQFPDLEDPDPLRFGLLPVQMSTDIYAYDQSRLRASSLTKTEDGVTLSSHCSIWDGKRCIDHWHWFRTNQNDFGVMPQADRAVENVFGLVNYLQYQLGLISWNSDRPALVRFETESNNGKPSDYVRVGREAFHGVECDVYLQAIGNQSDRYYIGSQDGRWYGAKIGIHVAPGDEEKYRLDRQRAIEEFLGHAVAPSEQDKAWQSLDSLPQDRKEAWCKLLYDRCGRHVVPCWEYWFSDFRDLGGNRILPYRQDFVSFSVVDETTIAQVSSRVTTISDVRIDEPLDDQLFEKEFDEGARVIDETHDPPLSYTYKKDMTDKEWQRIISDAKESAAEDIAQRGKVAKLIGQPAPPLPDGEWLNSEPLTWEDLHGRIVILKFWSVDCGPCYNELGALKHRWQGTDAADNESQPAMSFIGVHPPTTANEEIQAVLEKYSLEAPICIDRPADGKQPWGEFFAACEVNQMPLSVAIDEQGRILAHGSVSDVLSAVGEHRRKSSASK
jgi:hypothetical protein